MSENPKVPDYPEYPLDEDDSNDAPAQTPAPVKDAKTPDKPIENASNEPTETTVTKLPKSAKPEVLLVKLLEARTQALKNFLGDEQSALRFISSAMHAVQKVPALLKCTPDSVIGAFMECAAIKLYVGNGDCYVIPYGNEAQFQLGYKGIKTLAYRAGILKCGSEIVYKNDKFKEVLGTNPRLIHEPCNETDRGKAIGAYAWAEVTPGSVIFKYMTEAEIMEIKKMSKASSSKYSPWNSNDPQKWMWQKTAFKQLGKMMPTSDELDRAFYLDNVSERGGYIKKEGEVIEVDFDVVDQEQKIDEVNDKKQKMRGKKAKK